MTDGEMFFKKMELSDLQCNPFDMIGKSWYLLTSGTPEDYNTMTAHSGRDCDKAKQTGLRPVLLDGTTAFAQARRVLICRKRYTAMMQPEGFIEPETYERWYGTDPMHREFVGEVLAYYEKLH